jgi:hypothetical protein
VLILWEDVLPPRNITPLFLVLLAAWWPPARGFAEELQHEFKKGCRILPQRQWRQRMEHIAHPRAKFAQARSRTIGSIQSDQENAELTDRFAERPQSQAKRDIVSTISGLLVFWDTRVLLSAR